MYDPLIFANNRFSKIRSINTGRDGFLCQCECQNLFPLVWDEAESSLA